MILGHFLHSWVVSGGFIIAGRCAAQEAGYPDINIICEKVAAEGETRFEDRYRLPIGISVNMTSFSAKLLTSTLYNPRNILVFAQVHAEALHMRLLYIRDDMCVSRTCLSMSMSASSASQL